MSQDDAFLRLLCVDDNPVLLQMLALGFSTYGFEVVTASHGIEALLQFQAYHGNFGAVLTDNDMPDMNGVALLRQLRALGYSGCVLVMSGHLTPSDGQAYQDCAVSGFLHKPFDIGMVATMLMRVD
ncbi:MAG: response regulator [Methylacidiphilales bacterium]|nr:response regulator [Candidatus Methylacidiphilales bacterium]